MPTNYQWNTKIPLTWLVGQAVASFTCFCQSGNEQYMQIIDKDDNPISFTDENGNTQTFPIQGTGTGGVMYGVGSFVPDSQYSYYVQFGSASETPSVIDTNQMVLWNGTIKVSVGTFYGTEDTPSSGSPDYNDTICWIQGYLNAG